MNNVSTMPTMLAFILRKITEEVDRRNYEAFYTRADAIYGYIVIRNPSSNTSKMFRCADFRRAPQVKLTRDDSTDSFVFNYDTSTDTLLDWVFSAFGAYHP